jgi:DNA-binding NtrC family response regulator
MSNGSVATPLLGASAAMRALHTDIDCASRSDAKVMITGETGVGKEVVARHIHARGGRREGPFVTVNCAGVPDSLLESEFFGHVRGSFTGAFRDNPGLLRQAHRGTVFLDEVGEMSLRLQALLLRFLETGEIQTVGAVLTQGHQVDVRVITATNRNLLDGVAARTFREDLYYRLNVLHLRVPLLRERTEDIPILLEHYLSVFAEQHRAPKPVLSEAAIEKLVSYPWPGNVRELRNVVERLVLRADKRVIQRSDLPVEIFGSVRPQEADKKAAAAARPSHVEHLLSQLLVQRESFWTAVYGPFMSRDITRDDLRQVVRTGLERTQGSYRLLLDLFNIDGGDYKRFLGFLKQHDCHLPFRQFRMAVADSARRAPQQPGSLLPPARPAVEDPLDVPAKVQC